MIIPGCNSAIKFIFFKKSCNPLSESVSASFEEKEASVRARARTLASFHSYLNDSTGFLVAARQLCQLTVNRAIPIASNPPRAKIHQLNSVL